MKFWYLSLFLLIPCEVLGQHFHSSAPNTTFDPSPSITSTDFNTKIAQGAEQIVLNVDTLWSGGSPGFVLPLADSVLPIVSGYELTASIPSVLAVANHVQEGRMIAMGHDGFISNEAINLFDNGTFIANALEWLDQQDLNKVIITTGHREWAGGGSTAFHTLLRDRGFEVVIHAGSLDSTLLSGAGVVFVGNAWGDFTQSELDALKSYLEDGGGLMLLGLGWSWEPYNQGKTMDDYPMNKIGAFSGVRWVSGTITDPVHNYNGLPLFLTFYPNIQTQTSLGARTFVDSVAAAYGTALPAAVQSDEELRVRFITSLKLLKLLVKELELPQEQIADMDHFYRDLLTTYPQLFAKGAIYDSQTLYGFTWIRELLHRSVQDLLPLTPARKEELASLLNLTGVYRQLWDDFTLLLLDNSSLDEPQKQFIYNYLRSLPLDIQNLRSISTRDFLGENPHNVELGGIGGSVNIFSFRIGEYRENAFPEDISPGYSDVFSVVLAHEVNHVVDAYYVNGNPALKARRDALIAQAGENTMNYLRSMIGDGFFANAPQEFIASISNQWFTDSWKTLELGLSRLENKIPYPINQALFFAEIYSMGTDSTLFYRMDTEGNVERSWISVSRDSLGRMVSLKATESETYYFELDSNGDVLSYTTNLGTTSEPTSTLPMEFSLEQNYPNPFNPVTQIRFSLPVSTTVRLEVFTILGQPVLVLTDGQLGAGVHTLEFDGSGIASGVYLYKLTTPEFTKTRVMNLLK